ncbi:dihydroorotate dehydrogenase electron transfer subunit [Humitalea sp. 24SJ18S-53]|uniref:iron-sulfur cluster-binding protein n=1 Tax=Humitalea sp. 24SJ18S-53 TaxID=3422307 RepID=UPI003D669D4C
MDGLFPVVAHIGEVLASDPVGGRYHRLLIDAPSLSASVRPGQFCHLLCPGVYLRRPMSVWRAGPGEPLGFLFRVAGEGTAALAALRPGQALDAMGPVGRGFTLDPGWRRILILARGVGLATLSLLALRAAAQGIAVTAVLSAREPADLMQAAFTGDLSMDVHAVFDSDGSSAPDAVGALLQGDIAARRPDAVFTCGSDRLLRLLQAIAGREEIPGEAAIEQRMGCALGLCFSCVRRIVTADGPRDLRVCREGPVFDLQAIEAW